MRQRKSTTCLVVVAVLIPAGLTQLLAAYLAINFAYQSVHVFGSAMAPAVDDNDYLVAAKLAYVWSSPRRGDVVILRDPRNPARDLIKRVVGLPGDRLLVRDCAVSIDGRQLIEPYVREGWTLCSPGWPEAGHETTLGTDELFLMGDNRDHSTDSRTLGPVARSAIEARVTSRILPLDRAGPIDRDQPYFR